MDKVLLVGTESRGTPGATPSRVRGNIIGEVRRFRLREQALKRQDPVIKGVLEKAARASSEQTVWQGSRGSLHYRPRTNVLVGATPLSQTGFFLSRTARGLAVRPGDVDGLRQFLHQRK